jgi:hypothetical protein
MSRLVEFYRGQATDTAGRHLEDIWAWSDNDLEAVHDFIQWLFPLPEPSQFNPDAPLLTAEDISAFRNDPLLQARLLFSFARILVFLGLTLTEGGKKVMEGDNFAARAPDVWSTPNHNWLRITRLLRSMTLLGQGVRLLEAQTRALYEWLEALYRSRKFPISEDTFRYWTGAVGTR